MPRELLDATIDRLTAALPEGALRAVLLQLKSRPVFAEQWPDTYQAGLVKGKQRILQLETIRGDSFTLAAILQQDPEIGAWYDSIA